MADTIAAALEVRPTTASGDAGAHAGGAVASNELVTGELVTEELLVEEISIDGMCGVY
ncbi:MAG: hypothetical protein NVS3B21_19920 [Acidimicrobiales bacterium]